MAFILIVNVSDDQNATALFSDTEALYFIPVNNKNGTTNAGDLKLKINYDIVTKVTDTSNLTSTITNKEVSLPKNTFKKGTKHTYVLTIKMRQEIWLPKCRYRIYKQPCCKVLYFLDLTLIPLQKFWYQYLSSHLASP